jgi:hypothetical protein
MYPPHDQYVVIGVDPGKVTGLKVYARRENRDPWLGHDQVDRNDIAAYLSYLIGHWASVIGGDNVHIAVEKFVITTRTAALSPQADALEITGMVKGFAATRGLGGTITVHQLLKSNLKYANDDMLKLVGWYVPGKRHANDAARQAFALLKLIDHPHWNDLIRDASMKSEDEGRKTP